MSQPPPTDLEKSLDGLLAGLYNLLASRDRLASAQSIPVDNNAEVGLPSEADWEFLGLVASVGWGCSVPRSGGGDGAGCKGDASSALTQAGRQLCFSQWAVSSAFPALGSPDAKPWRGPVD